MKSISLLGEIHVGSFIVFFRCSFASCRRASGIGRVVCQFFAKEGATVVVADTAAASEISNVVSTLPKEE